MYRYDEFDARLVRERVAEFREQTARRLSGALSEDAFKPLRLMNGVYLQLHAYMLRVAIPYGSLSPRQLRRLAEIARRWDRGYCHVTTRQNVQFNWPALADIPDVLDALADVEMHAIQTSGNCIRNVTSDPYAGAAADEVADPRPWCELIRQWSTLHPEFSYLPRKFKIAVSAGETDRAAIRVHDIGLKLIERDGARGFRVFVGGGLGRTPRIGVQIRDFLPTESLLSYLESILRVYNLYGRRDNKYKARIKILVEDLGAEAFADLVEADWRGAVRETVDPPAEEIARIAAYFRAPAFHSAGPAEEADDPDFRRWLRVNVRAHRRADHRIVDISLKPVGGAPGDIDAAQMEALADLAEAHAYGDVRTTKEQNLCLPHVRQDRLYTLWRGLTAAGLATANIGQASDIVACPGLDYCNLANARSIPVAQRIAEAHADAALADDLGPVRINISGCINACGHHHVGDIGVLGVEKRGEEAYQILLGGSSSDAAAIGDIAGRALSADETVSAVSRLLALYRARRADGETFAEAFARLGGDVFREAVHGDLAA